MILTIAHREFKNLFVSPLAWSILATLQFLLAYIFLGQVESFIHFQAKLANIDHAPGVTDVVVVPLFNIAVIILLLVIPLLTMRLICEERRNKTLSLLLSAPISDSSIILGKYLGVLGLLLIILLLIALMPLSLLIGCELDNGKFISNLIGLSLVMISFTAVGLYMSSLASHPMIAALGSFSLLLLLWMLNWHGGLAEQGSALFNYLSLLPHLQALQNGLINSTDVSYFLMITAIFLILSIRRLAAERLQK
jgi:ABC-2 type transport system permease protein